MEQMAYKGWELAFDPKTGGSVTLCKWQGQDVLRPALTEPLTPQAIAQSAFPMVPFIGRISNGKFQFEGRDVSLPPNLPPEPHAIHGDGWQAVWEIETKRDDQLVLIYQHDGTSGWPWRYEARQRFRLTDTLLILDLSITNLDQTAMPAGLGWHPYFPREGAVLSADVTSIWRDEKGSIIGNAPQALTSATDLRVPHDVAALDLDHCYSSGPKGVHMVWQDRKLSVRMTADDTLSGHLTVYVPAGEDFFCVEPESHAPDAVNSELPADITGFRRLRRQDTLTGRILLECSQL